MRPVSVLIVDDCADTTCTMSMLLKAWGYATHVAGDGHSALALAEEHRPDVVMIDIGMPGMSGWDLARQLRQRPGGAAVTLIVISGHGQPHDRERSYEAGCDVHLIKPVEPSELRRLLEVLTPRESPLIPEMNDARTRTVERRSGSAGPHSEPSRDDSA
jgi:two-component system CheB/CheR fusion protein